MKIAVSKLKNRVFILNRLLNTYEEDLLNINNCMSDLKINWNGKASSKFFDKTEAEHKKMLLNVQEIKSLISIYDNIISDYINIGDTILFDESKKAYVYDYIQKYLEIIDQIIEIFEKIPVKYYFLIEQHKAYYINLRTIIQSIKEKYVQTFEKIFNNESKINRKCSKISIEIIKQSDFQE